MKRVMRNLDLIAGLSLLVISTALVMHLLLSPFN